MKKSIDLWIITSLIILQLFALLNLVGVSRENITSFLIYTVIGFISLISLYKIKLSTISQYTVLIYYLFIALFILTMIIAPEIRGAKRWIELPFFNFQVSELFKPLFILLIAKSIIKSKEKNISHFLSLLLIFSVPLFFIYWQPDLANTLLYSIVLFGMLFIAGYSIKYFGMLGILGAIGAPIIWPLLKDYQRLRIISFINPRADPLGVNYNINQSIIALGSGKLFGRGLGLGTQSTLKFLPEHHTDFAFAALVEQFGFIGGGLILALFFIIIYRLMIKIKTTAVNSYQRFYLIGCIILLISALTVNIGMNMGLMPVAGVTLPFISYGGSSTVALMMMIGLAMSI